MGVSFVASSLIVFSKSKFHSSKIAVLKTSLMNLIIKFVTFEG